MANVMAIISKAVFEHDAKTGSGRMLGLGDVMSIDRYLSKNKRLQPLGSGGALFLVTVRPPNEALWLVGVLEGLTFTGEHWQAAQANRSPITDISHLQAKLVFDTGKGITAKPGALGMSLQTPRNLVDSDVALLRAALGAPGAQARSSTDHGEPEAKTSTTTSSTKKPTPEKAPSGKAKKSPAKRSSKSKTKAKKTRPAAEPKTEPKAPAKPPKKRAARKKAAATAAITPDAARLARNAELEQQISKNPEEVTGYLVYADWLQSEGDPRGELIVLQQRLADEKRVEKQLELERVERELIAQHAELLFGPLAPLRHRLLLRWRLGFIHSARILAGGAAEVSAVGVARELLALAASCLIESLTLELDEVEWGDATREMLGNAPPTLKRLTIGVEDRSFASRRSEVDVLRKAYPQLDVRVRGLLGHPLPNRARARLGSVPIKLSRIKEMHFLSSDELVTISGSNDEVNIWDPQSGLHLDTPTRPPALHRLPGTGSDGSSPVMLRVERRRQDDLQSLLVDEPVGQDQRTELPLDRASSIAGFVPRSVGDDRPALVSYTREAVMLWPLDDSGDSSELVDARDTEDIYVARVSPDGQLVAAARSGQVEIWSVSGGKRLQQLSSPSFNHLCFSDGGEYLLAGQSGLLRVWAVPGEGRALQVGRGDRVLSGPPAERHEVISWRVACDIPFKNGLRAMASYGDRLVAADDRGDVRLWQLETGQEIGRFKNPFSVVDRLAVSSDGRLMASYHHDKIVRIWDLHTLALLFPAPGHDRSVVSLCWSADDQVLVAASSDRKVHLWDPAAARIRHSLGGAKKKLGSHITLSPDGEQLLVGGTAERGEYDTYGTLTLWDLNVRKPLRRHLRAPPKRVSGVAFSADGRAALAHDSNQLYAYDLQGNALSCAQALVGPSGTCLELREEPISGTDETRRIVLADPRAERIAIIDEQDDQQVLILDRQGNRLAALPAESPVSCLSFSPDGQLMAVGDEEGLVLLFDLETGEATTLQGHDQRVTALSFSSTGRWLASGSEDTTILIWDVADQVRVLQEPIQAQLERLFAGSASAAMIDRAAGDDQGKLAELPPVGEPLGARPTAAQASAFIDELFPDEHAARMFVELLEQPVAPAIAKHLDKRLAEAASELEKADDRGDLTAYRELVASRLSADDDPLPAGAVTRLGRGRTRHLPQHASGPRYLYLDDRQIKVFDSRSNTLLRTFNIPVVEDAEHLVAAISADGSRVAAGEMGDEIHVFDVDSGQQRHQLKGKGKALRALALSPDGALLASASTEWAARLWDLDVGKCKAVLKSDQRQINELCFFPDGKKLVLAAHDKTLRIWDIKAQKEVARLEGHKRPPTGVAVSPDQKIIASAAMHFDFDELRLWTVADCATVWSERYVACCGLGFSPQGLVRTWRWGRDREGQQFRFRRSPGGELVRHLGDLLPLSHAASLSLDTSGRLLLVGGSATLFDVVTGQPLYRFADDGGRAALCGNGALAAVIDGGKVQVFDARSNKQLRVLKHPNVKQVAFVVAGGGGGSDDDGDHDLITAGGKIGVKRWNTTNGRSRWTQPCNDVRLLVSSAQHIAVSDRHRIVVLDPSSGEVLATMDSTHELAAVALHPDGKTLVSFAENEGGIRWWNIESGQLESWLLFRTHVRKFGELAFSADGKLLAGICHYEGVILLFDLAREQLIPIKLPDKKWGRCVVLSPDGRRMFTLSDNRQVHVWDLRWLRDNVADDAREPINPLSAQRYTFSNGLREAIYGLAFSPDGQYLLSTGVRGMQLDRYRERELKAGYSVRGTGQDCAFSPDGQQFAAADERVSIRYMDGHAYHDIDCHPGSGAIRLAYSADGKLLVSVGADARVVALDPQTAEQLWDYQADPGLYNAVCFTSDDQQIIASHIDVEEGQQNFLTIHERQTGEARRHDLPDSIWTIAASPGGEALAAGGHSERVQLWDPKTFDVLRELDMAQTNRLCFSRDGKLLFGASQLGLVKVWRLDDDDAEGTVLWTAQPIYALAIDAEGGVHAADTTGLVCKIWPVED